MILIRNILINLHIIFNDITIREHELLSKIKTFIKWISKDENEITYLILQVNMVFNLNLSKTFLIFF